MKLNKTILSLLLSCTFVCSAVPSVSFAADTTIYDSTISDESKEAVSQDKNASGAVPFNVFDIYDAHQGYLAEHPEYSVPSLERDCLGIDVSQWQGNVDWAAVKASGVEVVILRAGYGKFSNQVDILIANLQEYQSALHDRDAERLRALLKEGREMKERAGGR